MLGQTGTCRSSSPVHPHITSFSLLLSLLKPSLKNKKGYTYSFEMDIVHNGYGQVALPPKQYYLVQHMSTCFYFLALGTVL